MVNKRMTTGQLAGSGDDVSKDEDELERGLFVVSVGWLEGSGTGEGDDCDCVDNILGAPGSSSSIEIDGVGGIFFSSNVVSLIGSFCAMVASTGSVSDMIVT